MKVLKFGGSSVASSDTINKVKDIVLEEASSNDIIVVVSALGGVTDSLISASQLASRGDEGYVDILKDIEANHINTCKSLFPPTKQAGILSKVKMLLNDLEEICKGIYLLKELTHKSQDCVVSFGERLSSLIIATVIQQQSPDTILVDPSKFIVTNNNHGNAIVKYDKTNELILKHFNNFSGTAVCSGFIASAENGDLTTLGRGGSDYTAAIIAAALDAEILEIWTDVSGMMTADPRLVSSAHVISSISYEEAMELSHFGAKVIYPPTIQPVFNKSIPVVIKNTFKPTDNGTLISNRDNGNNQLIKGLSSIKDIALINLKGPGMVGIPNFSMRLFKAISNVGVNIILITQASSEHSICVGITNADLELSNKAINEEFEFELSSKKIDPLEIETGLSILALVGEKMQNQVGVSGKMFSTLGENGINIVAIAQGSSERNISVVLKTTDLRKAINSLHESFFLSERKRLNLFVIGVGNVGKTLLSQIKAQQSYLLDEHHIDIRIAGVANSRTMCFSDTGIVLDNWESELASGEGMNRNGFVAQMKALNLRNSIFVDNTASEEIPQLYENILRSSISIVTPNKVACSSDQQTYQLLKKTAKLFKSKFLYETNVGAGLPVISTLNDLVKSGDRIIDIQAVLSGSLNFIFNNYNGTRSFKEIVEQAKVEGYTEPDPRIDLSGKDVMRKILILAREAGVEMEIDEITSEAFIPEKCMKAESVDQFFALLPAFEEHFKKMYHKAADQGKQLKYVATFKNGTAQTGLQAVGSDHPFYNLEGKDNIVLYSTARYPEQPLVVKGAGAGAEVTASGIFADIIKIANA